MNIYFIIYLVSALCAYKYYKKNNNKIYKWLAIFIPVLLAAFRKPGVGTDTLTYISSLFKLSTTVNTFEEYLSIEYTKSIEILYLGITYFVGHFFENINVLYFVFHFILTYLIFDFCDNISKEENFNIAIIYFVFLVLYYNKTFNMLRQSIAIAFCLYSIKYIFKENLVKFLICVCIGCGFHSTAVVFVPIYFIYIYVIKKDNMTLNAAFYSVIILFVVFFKYILKCFVYFNVLSSKYLEYFSFKTINVPTIEVVFLIICVCLAILVGKRHKGNSYISFFVHMCILSLIFMFCGYMITYMQRVTYYFCFCAGVIIERVSTCFVKKNRKIVLAGLIIGILIYSYLYYDVYLLDGTVPYMLNIKDIY